jgi:hypothetical protein
VNVKDRLKKAVEEKDSATCGKISDYLRRNGVNYNAIFKAVHDLTGIELAEWDWLLYESESAEGYKAAEL